MGSKRKVWLIAPTTELWLFKHLTDPRIGEDWAEKVGCEVAAALGLPHAHVELATLHGEPGCISLDFTHNRSRGELLLGRSLLRELDSQYPEARKFRNIEHTIGRIQEVLAQQWIAVPAGGPPLARTPMDLFAGYLLLDAVIGNVDRHHENWGVLIEDTPSARRAVLAPTFDHASSLGRELTDAERTERLSTRDQRRTVEHYGLLKARGAIYSQPGATRPLSPADLFARFARMAPAGVLPWLTVLRRVQPARFATIVDEVPETRMSAGAKQFAKRLLDATHSHLTRLPPP